MHLLPELRRVGLVGHHVLAHEHRLRQARHALVPLLLTLRLGLRRRRHVGLQLRQVAHDPVEL
eukprot:7054617-Alexandrium_andersonii.AAC.1